MYDASPHGRWAERLWAAQLHLNVKEDFVPQIPLLPGYKYVNHLRCFSDPGWVGRMWFSDRHGWKPLLKAMDRIGG
jgi:hypothetical protein